MGLLNKLKTLRPSKEATVQEKPTSHSQSLTADDDSLRGPRFLGKRQASESDVARNQHTTPPLGSENSFSVRSFSKLVAQDDYLSASPLDSPISLHQEHLESPKPARTRSSYHEQYSPALSGSVRGTMPVSIWNSKAATRSQVSLTSPSSYLSLPDMNSSAPSPRPSLSLDIPSEAVLHSKNAAPQLDRASLVSNHSFSSAPSSPHLSQSKSHIIVYDNLVLQQSVLYPPQPAFAKSNHKRAATTPHPPLARNLSATLASYFGEFTDPSNVPLPRSNPSSPAPSRMNSIYLNDSPTEESKRRSDSDSEDSLNEEEDTLRMKPVQRSSRIMSSDRPSYNSVEASIQRDEARLQAIKANSDQASPFAISSWKPAPFPDARSKSLYDGRPMVVSENGILTAPP